MIEIADFLKLPYIPLQVHLVLSLGICFLLCDALNEFRRSEYTDCGVLRKVRTRGAGVGEKISNPGKSSIYEKSVGGVRATAFQKGMAKLMP